MRAVVTRVIEASVTVEGEIVGTIGPGLLVLLGVAREDEDDDARALAAKVVGLRIFRDEHGAMNRSVQEIGGEILVVSQFTLLGDARRGRRGTTTVPRYRPTPAILRMRIFQPSTQRSAAGA